MDAAGRRGAVRIDVGHDDTRFAGARDRTGGSDRQAEPRNIRTVRRTGVRRAGVRFLHRGKLTQRHADRLVLALVQDVELDGSVGSEVADGPREFAGILDRFAVHRGDDVAGLDAGLGGGTVGLRLQHHRAFRFLHAEIIGDILRYRLDL